jgi:hypothetical protein
LPSRVQLNGGAVTVWYDPEKWGAPETDKEGMVRLDHHGPGSALLIAEEAGIPTERAADSIIEDFRLKYPELQVLLREKRTVAGHEVTCLKFGFTVSETPLILYMYCYGGLVGTVQVRTFAETQNFEECERHFTELLNGLEIRPSKYASLARLRQSIRFGAMVASLSTPVIAIVFLRMWLRTHLDTAMWVSGAMVTAMFLFGALYDLIKFRLK